MVQLLSSPLVASEVTKASDWGSYDVMVGNRENYWLSVYVHVADEFPIALSHGDIFDSILLPHTVEDT